MLRMDETVHGTLYTARIDDVMIHHEHVQIYLLTLINYHRPLTDY